MVPRCRGTASAIIARTMAITEMYVDQCMKDACPILFQGCETIRRSRPYDLLKVKCVIPSIDSKILAFPDPKIAE